MCTLIVAWQVFSDADLVIAANRDENLDRPAGPPALFLDRAIPVLAPVDLKAGGTWLGINASGLFCGITNRFSHPPDPARRSRGYLVFDGLAHPDARSATDALAGLSPDEYNSFHLVVADRQTAAVILNDGQQIHRRDLEPGFHVLTERSFGAAAGLREGWLRERLAPLAGGPAPSDDIWLELLSVHDPDDPFDGTCVHADWLRFGTRSTSLIHMGDPLSESRLAHGDGPACQTRPLDRSDLVRELFVKRSETDS